MLKNQERGPILAERVTTWLLVVLSLVVAGAGLVRVFCWEGTFLDRVDTTTLIYFCVAAALLLLRNVRSFSLGDYKVEFENLKKVADDARNRADLATSDAKYQVGAQRADGDRAEPKAAPGLASTDPSPGREPDDPWKDVFGGADRRNNRRLSAHVYALYGEPGWYKAELTVESTSPTRHPLTGNVRFFLHPTFPNHKPVVPVSADGRAILNLKAWGAFTVGALADDGRTPLEIDLSTIEDAPQAFKDQ